MKVGLFFGSFNPIHNGHLALANYMLEFTDLEQLWFVISPHNPLKQKKSLLADYHRYEMVNLAIGDAPRYKASNIEFGMPQPSYTIDTLVYLKDRYPQLDFVLLAGTDILVTFHKWKNHQEILANYSIYVYPRPGYNATELADHSAISMIEAPMMEMSSSFIRQSIKEGKDVRFFMPLAAYEYMREMHFYEK